jgi:predicted GIY-YIG superfamily endonuclease
MLDFYVYILKCSDGTYYTGHTDNLEKRIAEHTDNTYECYTSSRLPISVVFVQEFASRAEALEAERRIKKWGKRKKDALVYKGWEGIVALRKKKKSELY